MPSFGYNAPHKIRTGSWSSINSKRRKTNTEKPHL